MICGLLCTGVRHAVHTVLCFSVLPLDGSASFKVRQSGRSQPHEPHVGCYEHHLWKRSFTVRCPSATRRTPAAPSSPPWVIPHCFQYYLGMGHYVLMGLTLFRFVFHWEVAQSCKELKVCHQICHLQDALSQMLYVDQKTCHGIKAFICHWICVSSALMHHI